MLKKFPRAKSFLTSDKTIILVIIAVTVFTRFFQLTFQSLWFDELYSMCIANPTNSVGLLLSNLETDFHPPLFYLLLHGVFHVFSFDDFTARFLVATLGCMGVWLMYYLGKEINNKRTGLMSAFLLSIFFFHIKHSQEVRMYILLFVLVVATSILFLKALKKSHITYLILYVMLSVLSIYTHYYAFFIMLAQGLCLLHLLIAKKINSLIFKKFVLAYVVVMLLYMPWISTIISTSQRNHFMDLPNMGYLFEYMYNYTGKEPLTTLVFLFGMGLFASILWKKNKTNSDSNPGYVLINYSLVSVIIITFIVSVFKPLINQNSMMAVLPFVVIAVSIGYQECKPKTVLILFAALFVSNAVNFIFINNYYTKSSKENFKQISTAIASSVQNEPNTIVVSQIADFYGYYFKQMKANVRMVNPNEQIPNEILTNVNSFYVVNAPFTKEASQQLEEIDPLGFLILYPKIKDKVRDITVAHNRWVNYIDAYFEVDSTFINQRRNTEVAFRYNRIKK